MLVKPKLHTHQHGERSSCHVIDAHLANSADPHSCRWFHDLKENPPCYHMTIQYLHGDFTIISPSISSNQILNFKKTFEFHPSGNMCMLLSVLTEHVFSESIVGEIIVKSQLQSFVRKAFPRSLSSSSSVGLAGSVPLGPSSSSSSSRHFMLLSCYCCSLVSLCYFVAYPVDCILCLWLLRFV